MLSNISTAGVVFDGRSAEKPLITIKEARKILGSSYAKMPDNELRRVIIAMGDLARLLSANPDLFNVDELIEE